MNTSMCPSNFPSLFLPELQIPLNMLSLCLQSAFKVLHFNFPLAIPVCLLIMLQDWPLNLPLQLLEFWTPLRKQDNCQNMCHYTCMVYKLNLIDIVMCLIICHSYSHNAGVIIELSFLSPLTQAPSPSTRTLIFISDTHTQNRNHEACYSSSKSPPSKPVLTLLSGLRGWELLKGNFINFRGKGFRQKSFKSLVNKTNILQGY